VYARAGVEGWLIHIGTDAISATSDYDITARFLRPHLHPVNIVPIKQRLTETH